MLHESKIIIVEIFKGIRSFFNTLLVSIFDFEKIGSVLYSYGRFSYTVRDIHIIKRTYLEFIYNTLHQSEDHVVRVQIINIRRGLAQFHARNDGCLGLRFIGRVVRSYELLDGVDIGALLIVSGGARCPRACVNDFLQNFLQLLKKTRVLNWLSMISCYK